MSTENLVALARREDLLDHCDRSVSVPSLFTSLVGLHPRIEANQDVGRVRGWMIRRNIYAAYLTMRKSLFWGRMSSHEIREVSALFRQLL